MSRTSSRRGLLARAIMNVSRGPNTTSTPTITMTTWVTSVRWQLGKSYHPNYRPPSISDTAEALQSSCSPNAFSLNFMAIFCTIRRQIEDREAPAADFCGSRHTARRGGSRYGDAALVALRGWRHLSRVVPQAKAAEECKIVAAEARILRQPFQLTRVAAAHDHVVGFQRRAELCDHLADGAAPFFETQLFQAVLADPLFVSASPFIAQVREFHRRDDAIDDHGGAKAGAEAEKQHAAAFVAADCLHGCIVDDVGRSAKRPLKIECHPTVAQIVRFRCDFAVEHDSRIPDGDGIVGPVPGELVHTRHHLTRRKLRSRFELTQLASPENAHLHVAAADVDGEYSSVPFGFHILLRISGC